MTPPGAFACMLARPRRPPPLVRAVSVEHGPVHGASRSWLPVFAGRRARLRAAIARAQRFPAQAPQRSRLLAGHPRPLASIDLGESTWAASRPHPALGA